MTSVANQTGIDNICKSKLIKKIYIPGAFEFAVGFIASITDVAFITLVDITLLNVMMVMINFLVVGYVATGVGANIAAAKLVSNNTDNCHRDPAASGRVLLLVLFLGGAVSFLAYFLGPILVGIVDVTPRFHKASEIIISILAFNVLFIGVFKAQNAILAIHAKSIVSLWSSIAVVVLNIVLNWACYYWFFDSDLEIFAISIPVATLVSRGAVSIVIFIYLSKWKFVEFNWQALFKYNSIKLVVSMAKTACVSSVETLSFVCVTYLFLAALANINPDLLTIRNYAAPWFLLVISSTMAWSNLANRQIAFDGIPTTHVGYLTFKWIAIRSISSAIVWTSVISIFLYFLVSENFGDLVDFQTLLFLLLSLSAIELLRSLNVMTLTALRLHNDVTKPAYFAVVIQSSIGLVLWLISIVPLRESANLILPAGIFALFLLVFDEALRATLNMRYFRRTIRLRTVSA